MSVAVRPARSFHDVGAFIDLPFRLHAGTPWVPPLKLERRLFLSRRFGHLRQARRLRAVRSPSATGVWSAA